MITVDGTKWDAIEKQLKIDYSDKPSIFLIRAVMRRELGFTVRQHDVWPFRNDRKNTVYLDFFDASKKTLFILKYM